MTAHPGGASWFETRGVATLLTMRVKDLVLRSIAERCVSKDEAAKLENVYSRSGKDASA
jgi:hypothetical protein